MRTQTGLALVGAGIAITVAVVLVLRSGGESESESTVAAGPGSASGSATSSSAPSADRAAPAGAPAGSAGKTGSASIDGMDDSSRHELIGMYGPGTMRTVPARYELQLKDGYAAINLGGGAPTHYRAMRGSRPEVPMRALRGRVVDTMNKPVAGAIVVANESIEIMGGQLLADAGATTGADGTFAIDKVRTDAVVQAFDRTGWSDVVATTGDPVELVIRGHGSLRGTLTYDGHAESFTITLTRSGAPGFRVMYQSDPDGTYAIASLPVGTYTMMVGLAQSIQGGSSKFVNREVPIAAGETAIVNIDQRSATVVVATTQLPAGLELSTIEYSLLPGKPPADRKDASTRTRAGEGSWHLVGGIDAKIALQFHDVEPGAYHVCAAVNDDALWGCMPVVVVDGDVAREIAIRVSAPASK